MPDQPAKTQFIRQRQLFYDKTENGLINNRILRALYEFADQLELTNDQKRQYFNALLLQAKKLLSIWTHLDRFEKEIERLKPEAPILDPSTGPEPAKLSYSQELYLEFDEFLVQYKSSLDYLAKMPAVFYGRDKWNPRTFGDEGKRVLNLLRNVLAKDKKWWADVFETKIFKAHKADIEMAVAARDKVNHYLEGGIPFEQFAVIGIRKEDSVIYQTPMWNNEQTIDAFMRIAFYNHLKFCEDFIVFFLGFYVKKGYGFLHMPVAADSPVSPWKLIPEVAVPLFVGGAEIVDEFPTTASLNTEARSP